MQGILDFEKKLCEMQIDIEQFGNVETLKEICIDTITLLNDCLSMTYSVCFDMPKGYEDAWGLTQDDTKTVYMNLSVAIKNSVYDFLYYFLHEVRHSIQYSFPSLFSPLVRKSLEYVIQYDGTILYKVNNEWKQHKIIGTEDYLKEFYMSSPCEVDANEFALKTVTLLFPNISFDRIKEMWFPQYKYFDKAEFSDMFSAIIKDIESAC